MQQKLKVKYTSFNLNLLVLSGKRKYKKLDDELELRLRQAELELGYCITTCYIRKLLHLSKYGTILISILSIQIQKVLLQDQYYLHQGLSVFF